MIRLRIACVWTLCVAAAVVTFGSRPLPAASPCEWNGIDRIVAVGDVHGAHDRFLEILKIAGILGADAHWAAGNTHVVQLGDIVDRGGDSRKTLDFVRRLEREAQTAGGQLHLLLGNHEVARMLGDLRLVVAGEYAAFATANSFTLRESYLKTLRPPSKADQEQLLEQMPLGFVEMRQAFGRDGEYGRWLRQLPVTIKINGFQFVHGGISPAVAPLGCQAINDQVRREMTNDLDKTRAAPLASLAARPDGPLWYRGLAQEPDTFAPQIDEILAKTHARAIVVAHTVTPSGRITPRFDGRVIQIDTGMQPAYVPGGRASALEIRRGEATAIYVDRRDSVNVAREGSEAVAPGPAWPRR
jgi:diadenosine tetraphosphatase ApaH/serine/threonine PP2A family protein phosphatase